MSRLEFLRKVDLTKTPFQIKVSDFGLAISTEGKGENFMVKGYSGTPYYMPP